MRTLSEDVELSIQDMEYRVPDLDARRTGTLVNTVAGIGAGLKRDAQRHALREFRKTFVATARGEDLDILADDHFGLIRHAASSAIGRVAVVRNTAAAFTVPAGSILLDAQGVEYRVQSAALLTGFESTMDLVCSKPGTVGNRSPDQIFTPASWTQGSGILRVYNTLAIAGGNEAESDEQFRRRIAAWWRALRRGTVEALRYVALTLPEVRGASVDEQRIRPHRGGWVDLYVADAQDTSNIVMQEAVRRVIDRDGRAAGIVVNVWGATVTHVPIVLSFIQQAGNDGRQIYRAVEAVLRYVNNLEIGAPLYRARIAQVALSGNPSIRDVQVQSPVADLIPAASQVLRARPQDIRVA